MYSVRRIDIDQINDGLAIRLNFLLQLQTQSWQRIYFTGYLPNRNRKYVTSVWCNQMETVLAEMSSWTTLTWYTVMKTAFKTQNMKSELFGIFNMKILNFNNDWRIYIFKEIQHMWCNQTETVFAEMSSWTAFFWNFIMKIIIEENAY